MTAVSPDFSYTSREKSLYRFEHEVFDLLVIGGGITGAAVAREASLKGLKVALVEKGDYATGTSSRSSKLIHGGLRYLQGFELGLVFEALSERALLLKTAPHLVRPVPFYMPVYAGDPNGMGLLSMGLWLYDTLALFRSPGMHRRLCARQMIRDIPSLKSEGLKGGFRYYDATMWDDVLAVETLRSAQTHGAAVANYLKALGPLWKGDLISGFRVRDCDPFSKSPGREFDLRAHRVVVCVGPWTDELGISLSPHWKKWLEPSKGIHLIFDLKRLTVPGAMVMNGEGDGRISFVIPRPDMGAGVAIVGTTDSPSPKDPDQAAVDAADIGYLMKLLQKYFPSLNLSTQDILSAYVGVRPLLRGSAAPGSAKTEDTTSAPLQKISREHHIDMGPGGSVVVAGGKYTTHRKMAEEIVDFTLKAWQQDVKNGKHLPAPPRFSKANSKQPCNPAALGEAVEKARVQAKTLKIEVPEALYSRYGARALELVELGELQSAFLDDPEGFPLLSSQLRYGIRKEMVMRLEDFYLRRAPLYLARADHGLPWAEKLAYVWAEERGLGAPEAKQEFESLKVELEARSQWSL
ncbi:glycerol-3-phosphate dehydrogenase/oxidase [Bdellovibrionota bacterium FG-2]